MIVSTINWQPANLENELVKLAPLTESDFDRIYVVASDPLIWEQHPSSDRYKKEVFQQYFDSAIDSKSAFLIIDKATNTIIGCTRYYDYDPKNSGIAIGFTFLARKFWGGQHNRACKELLLDYAFQYVDNVLFHIGPRNFRSQRGTMKIGAKKLREIERDYNGNYDLRFEYLIEKKDWRK